MKTRLLNNLEEGVKAQVHQEYLSSARLRKRITELLEADAEAIYKGMRDSSDYEKAAWAYQQAEKIGEIKALKKLIGLFE
tara:strand:- start:16832 stop:17071 length:240 start_codon:yes stop_codon:yes gene_type:complete